MENRFRYLQVLCECLILGDPIDVLDFIKNGANVNLADENGKTPLHIAAEKGKLLSTTVFGNDLEWK